MNVKHGGPAFPGRWTERISPTSTHTEVLGGMSLRDWFAGQALGTVWNTHGQGEGIQLQQALARACYALADAMLAERAKMPS